MEAIIDEHEKEYPDRTIYEKLSSSEVIEDIKFLLKTIDDVHPNPNQVIGKSDFQNAAYQCNSDLDSITIKDF